MAAGVFCRGPLPHSVGAVRHAYKGAREDAFIVRLAYVFGPNTKGGHIAGITRFPEVVKYVLVSRFTIQDRFYRFPPVTSSGRHERVIPISDVRRLVHVKINPDFMVVEIIERGRPPLGMYRHQMHIAAGVTKCSGKPVPEHPLTVGIV